MAVAALSMYNEPAKVKDAYQILAEDVAARLGVELNSVPEDLASLWLHPHLLLAQTCGFPWASQLRGKVQLVATPRYSLPGCEGMTHCAFLLIPETCTASNLEDLRGKRAVINGLDSNSGMNLFRDAVAPLSNQGRFFGEVLQSGSHVNSMRMLQRGEADVASIDAVTYGYLRRDLPGRVAGLRILQRTRQSPALPLICAATYSDETVQALRNALSAALAQTPAIAETLAIEGFEPVSEDKYLPVIEWQEEAIRQGYPVVA